MLCINSVLTMQMELVPLRTYNLQLSGIERLPMLEILEANTLSVSSTKRVEVLRKTLTDVQADESRIRSNLAAVSASDALRTRLMRALDADETKIEQLGNSIAEATAAADKAHRTLVDAIAALHI